MARTIHEFRRPERFVAGTVGQPGDRTFFLQVTSGAQTLSVQIEKQQVVILADRLGYLLDEVERRFGTPVPAEADVTDTSPLEMPIDAEFHVGSMGLGWDAEAASVVVELLAVTDEPIDEDVILDDTAAGPDTVRVFLTAEAAREFSARSQRVVAAGRPTCPLCNQPLDPGGHICARSNGYKRDGEFSRSLEFVDPEVLAMLGRLMPGFDAAFEAEDLPAPGSDAPGPAADGDDTHDNGTDDNGTDDNGTDDNGSDESGGDAPGGTGPGGGGPAGRT
ncbi:hypothetical protein GOHSU_02_02320 [Gordonia hirsuta DSM 44140 = NBRC 16056]|uniref:DUF3090 domain-containing protein n=1 Tax=Gordonia hirsuta DSM 44140 = NBRC 16056 TaxID=1121927 RepID=L7L7T6_9ACTN|nr:DUF3090 domain-containing protein [Gordonia hirsuta]GAC56083.1 hypothetical protein GOHSU_02_02320 [Gordonia hirsuta DSM 44140 = NBRC 16056]